MTLQELYEKLAALTPEQRRQIAYVFGEEQEVASEITSLDESDEDIYWDYGDCLGNKEQAKEHYHLCDFHDAESPEFEEWLSEFTIVPKGILSLWAEQTTKEK